MPCRETADATLDQEERERTLIPTKEEGNTHQQSCGTCFFFRRTGRTENPGIQGARGKCRWDEVTPLPLTLESYAIESIVYEEWGGRCPAWRKSENEETMIELTCPWCGEADFDAMGLKIHIARGWCEAYENLDGIAPHLVEQEEGEGDTLKTKEKQSE
jgi:hypothetical protein